MILFSLRIIVCSAKFVQGKRSVFKLNMSR